MRSKNEQASTQPVSAARIRVRRAVVSSASNGVISMGATDFAQFEECMSNQKKPSAAMVQAAELHLALTKSR